MIIHCSQCGTRYRFSEEKTKPSGTKVRCVRCRNVFLVMPEEELSSFETIFEPEVPAPESEIPEKGMLPEAVDQDVPVGGLFTGVPSSLEAPVEEQPASPEPEEAVKAEDKDFYFDPSEDGEGEHALDFFEDPGAAEVLESDLFADPTVTPGEDVFTQEPHPDVASPEPEKQGRSVFGRIFLLLFFLLVIFCSGIAGYLFWRGEPFNIAHLMNIFQQTEPAAQKPAGKIYLKGVKSFYVFNQEAGQLFVISGTAVNEFSEGRSGLSVRGMLYDGEGRELRQQTVFCGNPFEKEVLTDMSYKTIEETMNNQFGTTFSNLNIAPGKEIPFSIVFRNLPENLAEFSVEMVSSKPAAKK